MSELPTGGGRRSARSIILMLIICSSKRKIRMKRHSKPMSPRIQRLNMSWRLRETRVGKSTSTTVTCSQGSRARYEAKARARSCEKPPSTMRSTHYSLPGPYLIKLDTHGYEVPILCGATETLRNTNLLVIETYNFRFIESSLLFHEIIAYMRERGFGVIDMSEPHWRVLDFAFWQIDLFFVRLNRPEFLVNTYR